MNESVDRSMHRKGSILPPGELWVHKWRATDREAVNRSAGPTETLNPQWAFADCAV